MATLTGRTSTRGDLAYAIYGALGITEPSSTGKFGDSGPYLDSVTSTLSDLGITAGVGDGQFGTMAQTTRGEAFTMIARALGLADNNTDIGTASQALVGAGIVHGYGNGDLGLNDPLTDVQLDMLMGRLGPELDKPGADGTTRRENLNIRADDSRNQSQAAKDPTFAAFLREQGIKDEGIVDEVLLRGELFNEDARRRSETYGRATEQAQGGIQTDFENRGLFKSGARMRKEAESAANIGFQQESEGYHAQRQHEEGLRALGGEYSSGQKGLNEALEQSMTKGAETKIEEPYI